MGKLVSSSGHVTAINNTIKQMAVTGEVDVGAEVMAYVHDMTDRAKS